MAPCLFTRLGAEIGFHSILSSSRDTKLLCLQRFVRLFAYGLSTLILVLYLSNLGISDARIGLFMTLTLLGDVLISFCLTLVADNLGRRKILMGGAALMTFSGAVFTMSGNYWVLVGASIVGVISPSGNEIGPFKAIEESTLAQLTPKEIRSDIFAWYTLIGTAGSAMGSVTCGWAVERLQKLDGWSSTRAFRAIFMVYAVLGLVKLVLALFLSPKCEPESAKPSQDEITELDSIEVEGLLSDSEDENSNPPSKVSKVSSRPSPFSKKSLYPAISPSSRTILIKLCALFAIDSLASGLVAASWLTYFFTTKFSLPESQLGTLFFVSNIVSSASNLVASSISKRIGLLQTMVFTHLPSAIMLALIPVPNVAWLAMLFLVLRSCTSSMDQAPRQAFLAAAVLPSERTAVMGVVNVVKTLSQSGGGPVITGWLAGMGKFWIVFLIAGAMKVTYDLSMLKMFVGFRGREEDVQIEGRDEA